MKNELNDTQLDNVIGGTVIISEDYMNIGFTTLREMYNLKNCTFKDVRNFVGDLKDENKGLTNAAFDVLCRDELKARGWI